MIFWGQDFGNLGFLYKAAQKGLVVEGSALNHFPYVQNPNYHAEGWVSSSDGSASHVYLYIYIYIFKI